MRLSTAIVVMATVAAACSPGATESIGETPALSSPPQTPPTIPVIPLDPLTAPPDVDMTRHSVPLEEIFFDTFDGGAVRLSDSTPALRSRLLDAIPPIDEPMYEAAGDAIWLEDSDLVLGYASSGQAYAYAFKILNFHEIVNDVIDGRAVLISYCPLCRSGVVYDRSIDGEVLSFGNTSALYESDLVMVDRTTGSYWWQVAGKAIVGPLTDKQLEPLPSEVSTWGEWRTTYPETVVLSRDTGFSRPYARDSFADYADVLDRSDPPFSFGTTSDDGRLPPNALVVAVQIEGIIKAYAVDGLASPINDSVGPVPLVVVPLDGGAAVFSSTVGDEAVEFEFVDGVLVDVATSSTWTAGGVAIDGPLAGSELTALPIRTSFWFAMVGAFPDLVLYER